MTKTALWDAVVKTDPKHTKAFTRAGGFRGTAIKPLYLIHKATELWGPMGDAWGAESIEHVISGKAVYIRARVWYPNDGREGEVEHWGGDVLVKGDKDIPNDEAFKMAFTDAVGKCLVQLGFGADVHMGLFDDSKYIEELKAEFGDEKKPEAAISEIFKDDEDRKIFLATFLSAVESAKTTADLKDRKAIDQARLSAMGDSKCPADVDAFNKILAAYNPMFTALKQKEKQTMSAKPATVDAARTAAAVLGDDDIGF